MFSRRPWTRIYLQRTCMRPQGGVCMHECMRDDLCIFIRVLASGIYSTITGHEYRHMYIKAHEEPIIQPPGPQYRRKVQIFTLRHLSWPSTPPATKREPDIDEAIVGNKRCCSTFIHISVSASISVCRVCVCACAGAYAWTKLTADSMQKSPICVRGMCLASTPRH